MKLYTEEQVRHAIKMARSSHNIFTTPFMYDQDEVIEHLTPIELPSDEEIHLMAEKHAEKCGLKNFFDEDEITIIKYHWLLGYKSAIKDFSSIQIQGGNNE